MLGGLACGTTAYILYRWYYSQNRSPSSWQRLQQAVKQYTDSVVSTAQLTAATAADLQRFLQSEDDELPRSIQQLCKLVALSLRCSVPVLPVLPGMHMVPAEQPGPGSHFQLPWPERMLQLLDSSHGQSLIALVVGSGARSFAKALCEHFVPSAGTAASGHLSGGGVGGQPGHGRGVVHPLPGALAGDNLGPRPDWMQRMCDVLSTPNGRRVMEAAISVFVTRGMEVWLSSIDGDVDPWQQIFRAAAMPEHGELVHGFTATLTRTAVQSAMHGFRCVCVCMWVLVSVVGWDLGFYGLGFS